MVPAGYMFEVLVLTFKNSFPQNRNKNSPSRTESYLNLYHITSEVIMVLVVISKNNFWKSTFNSKMNSSKDLASKISNTLFGEN